MYVKNVTELTERRPIERRRRSAGNGDSPLQKMIRQQYRFPSAIYAAVPVVPGRSRRRTTGPREVPEEDVGQHLA